MGDKTISINIVSYHKYLIADQQLNITLNLNGFDNKLNSTY